MNLEDEILSTIEDFADLISSKDLKCPRLSVHDTDEAVHPLTAHSLDGRKDVESG